MLNHTYDVPLLFRYIIPIVTFSLVYNLPKFFELKTGVKMEQVNFTVDGHTEMIAKYSIEPTELRTDPLYIKIYCIWMNFAFMGVGPFCLLFALNALTVRSLIINSRPNSTVQYSSSKRNEVALAKVRTRKKSAAFSFFLGLGSGVFVSS